MSFWARRLCGILLVVLVLGVSGCAGSAFSGSSGSEGEEGDTIEVGILHSLSGTMSISEISLRDAELQAYRGDQRGRGCSG